MQAWSCAAARAFSLSRVDCRCPPLQLMAAEWIGLITNIRSNDY